MYLYKYFYKGNLIQASKISSNGNKNTTGFDYARAEFSVDEVANFVDGRLLPASEAAWRFFEYDTTRRDPSVKVYPVHLLDRDYVTYKKGQRQAAAKTMSKLDRYFHRPSVAEFDKLTYLEYHKKFVIAKQAPKTIKETRIDQASTELTNTVYRRKKQHIARNPKPPKPREPKASAFLVML